MKTQRKRQRGFSLIELLIVVAIILIIAAIAVPSLLSARTSAANTQVAANLKSLVAAEAMYHDNFRTYGPLSKLGSATAGTACAQDAPTTTPTPTAQGCFVPDNLAQSDGVTTAAVNGYNYATSTTDAPTTDQWLVSAVPTSTAKNAKAFCVMEDGVIHFDPTGSASTGVTSRSGCAKLGSI